jgi:hypothetical protein
VYCTAPTCIAPRCSAAHLRRKYNLPSKRYPPGGEKEARGATHWRMMVVLAPARVGYNFKMRYRGNLILSSHTSNIHRKNLSRTSQSQVLSEFPKINRGLKSSLRDSPACSEHIILRLVNSHMLKMPAPLFLPGKVVSPSSLSTVLPDKPVGKH